MSETKNNHGGARIGAGRKKGTLNSGEHKTGRIVISCTKNEETLIKELAEKMNITVSKLVIDKVLNN